MKKILTIIFDGFGYREEEKGNAIAEANMTCFKSLWNKYPHSLLEASGPAVGLKEGEFGNSETGHQTIGAGRVIKQNETLVDEFLDSDVLKCDNFKKLIKDKDRTIHLMGLCSDGGVHSDIFDIIKFYRLLIMNDIKNICFHIITDGRDTDIHSSYKYIGMIQDEIKKFKIGNISTICGRYYAMDRDKHYNRTKIYYDLVTKGSGIISKEIKKVINSMYNSNITDEFLQPILVEDSLIKDNDALVWLNYREDRAKQIIETFVNKEFEKFKTEEFKNLEVYSFLPIDENIETYNFINEDNVKDPLGVYLSKLGLTQARIAETEKFPHVTYFFDGGFSGKLPKCNNYLIPSPSVSTYDKKPEMSAVGITKKVVECMQQDYDFILINFANADMVGHTGDYDATVKACMAIDLCLNKIIEKAEENFYKVIILADHGNADIMISDSNSKVTTHTTSKVPFIITDEQVKLKEEGNLTMVAPTILEYMDIAVPEEMKNTPILIEK